MKLIKNLGRNRRLFFLIMIKKLFFEKTKVNHFPKSLEITRKDNLCKNIQKMQQLHGVRNFNFIPKTFVLPRDFSLLIDDSEKN